MSENRSTLLELDTPRLCHTDQCPELLRATAEADRLRALLAKALDHIPTDTPLANESRSALD
jgi:hypothetical protein